MLPAKGVEDCVRAVDGTPHFVREALSRFPLDPDPLGTRAVARELPSGSPAFFVGVCIRNAGDVLEMNDPGADFRGCAEHLRGAPGLGRRAHALRKPGVAEFPEVDVGAEAARRENDAVSGAPAHEGSRADVPSEDAQHDALRARHDALDLHPDLEPGAERPSAFVERNDEPGAASASDDGGSRDARLYLFFEMIGLPADAELLFGPFVGLERLLRHEPDAARMSAVAFLQHVRGEALRRIGNAELLLHGRPRHRHEPLRDSGVAADASHLFEHDDAPSCFSRLNGGGKACCARAHNQDVGSGFRELGKILRKAPEAGFRRGQPGAGLPGGEERPKGGPCKDSSAAHYFSSLRMRFTLLTA